MKVNLLLFCMLFELWLTVMYTYLKISTRSIAKAEQMVRGTQLRINTVLLLLRCAVNEVRCLSDLNNC